jgi:hypothetical protein
MVVCDNICVLSFEFSRVTEGSKHRLFGHCVGLKEPGSLPRRERRIGPLLRCSHAACHGGGNKVIAGEPRFICSLPSTLFQQANLFCSVHVCLIRQHQNSKTLSVTHQCLWGSQESASHLCEARRILTKTRSLLCPAHRVSQNMLLMS